MHNVNDNKARKRRHTGLLLVVAVGMFGFSFALVPLYNVFCELTGLNGKTSGAPANADEIVEMSDREVIVQFAAQVARGMPWEFRPTENQLRVRLGQVHVTEYVVRNRAAQQVTGQAVPSVAPGLAARHLIKIECFCFTQQVLDAGAEMNMPVQFYVAADLPEEVRTISLSYTMFRADDPDAVQTNHDVAGHDSGEHADEHGEHSRL